MDINCIFENECNEERAGERYGQVQQGSNVECVSKYHSLSVPILDSNSMASSAPSSAPKYFEFNQNMLLCGKGRHFLSSGRPFSFISMNVMMRRGGLYSDKFLGQAVINVSDYYNSFMRGENIELSAGIRDKRRFPIFQKVSENQCNENSLHHHNVEGGGALRVRLSMPRFNESCCGWFEEVSRDDHDYWFAAGSKRSIWLILIDKYLYLHSSPYSTSIKSSNDTLIRKLNLHQVSSINVVNHMVSGEATDVLEISIINHVDSDNGSDNETGACAIIGTNGNKRNGVKTEGRREEKLFLKWLEENVEDTIRKSRREQWLTTLWATHRKLISGRN